MSIVVGILLVIIALLVGGAILGVALNLLWYLIVGLIIGSIGRLVLPGKHPLGLLATALYGVAGSLIGGMVADQVLDWGTLGSLVLSVAFAAILVSVFGGWFARDEAQNRE